MKKEFIGYTEALALKELGFDKPCLMYWNDFGKTSINRFQLLNKIDEWCQDYIEAPLYQQAFRWFREKYRINMGMTFKQSNGSDIFYDYCIHYPYGSQTKVTPWSQNNFTTYEEAQLACLNKLIEIVKNK
jgi:hypothetical protein